MSGLNGHRHKQVVPRREGVAVGRFIECRFWVPNSKPPRTALGMALVKEVHPDKLVVKVFSPTGMGQPDPIVEIDRVKGEWRLLYPSKPAKAGVT